MLMSKRVQEIIEIILDNKGYITIQKIAGKIGVSERTIYKEIPEVTKIMKEYHIELESASKKGLIARGTPQDIRNLKNSLGMEKDIYIVDSKDRENMILLYLLHENDYIKTEAVAIDNDASVPTVRNDLKRIQEKLVHYDLQLLQKKGEGIYIQGETIEKSHLAVRTLIQNVEEHVVYQWMNTSEDSGNLLLRRMEGYGYRSVAVKAHGIVQNVLKKENEFGRNFCDRDYFEFVLLIAAMTLCHQKGRPYNREFEVNALQRQEKKLIRNLIRGIQETFDFHMTDCEEQYLTWALHICMIPEATHIYTIRNHRLDTKIYRFIQYVEERMGIHLMRDADLKNSLYVHMDKALTRIRSGMCIRNDMMEETKRDYQELFQIIREGVEDIFKEDYFPDDEIAYLVLYFAVSLDHITKHAFRIIVVCSGGMGSSKMLANRIEQEIPAIAVKKTASLMQFEQENLDDYDLILSTIPLYIENKNYLKVSPLLNENELEQIREAIKRHKYQTLRKIEVREKEKHQITIGDNIRTLENIHSLTKVLLEMAETFCVLKREKTDSIKSDLVREVMKMPGFETLSEGEVRERFCNEIYFIIPMTDIVFDECIIQGMEQPRMIVFNYEEKSALKTNPNDYYRNSVCILYAQELKDMERILIRRIIENVLEDSDCHEMICRGDARAVRQWLAFRYRAYLKALLAD